MSGVIGGSTLPQRQIAFQNGVWVSNPQARTVSFINPEDGVELRSEPMSIFDGDMQMKALPSRNGVSVLTLTGASSTSGTAGIYTIDRDASGKPFVNGPLPFPVGKYSTRAFDVDERSGSMYVADEQSGQLHRISLNDAGSLLRQDVSDKVVQLDAAKTHLAADDGGVWVIQNGSLFRIGNPMEGDLDLNDQMDGRPRLNTDRVSMATWQVAAGDKLVADTSGEKHPLKTVPVPVGGAQDNYQMAVIPHSHAVGVLNESSGHFLIRYPNGETYNWMLPPGEHHVAANPANTTFLVTNADHNTAFEYDTDKHPEDTDNPHVFYTGERPGSVAYHPSSGYAFIKNGNDSLTLIDDSGNASLIGAAAANVNGTPMTTLEAGNNVAMSVDPVSGNLYIANAHSVTRQIDAEQAEIYPAA